MAKKSILIIIGIVVLTSVVGGASYFYYRNMQKNTFTARFNEARSLAKTGSPLAIPSFEEAVKSATTKDQEGVARLNLGFFSSYQDRVKAVGILKEVVADESLPPQYRAAAVNYIVNLYFADYDVDFTLRHVFTGDKWQSFLPTEMSMNNRALALAARRAYEWSASIYPTFTAEYRIAWWYGKEIIAGKATSTQQDGYVKIIRDRIRDGDAALQLAQKNGAVRSQIGLGYTIKGLAMAGLYSAHAVPKENVEGVYFLALKVLEKDPNDGQSKSTARFARYHYAAFLARVDKNANKQKILDILSPLYGSSQGTFYSFLSVFRDNTFFGNNPTRDDIVTLASLDPRFKDLLFSMGWKTSDF